MITLDNYEIYMIDYLDGRLTDEQRAEVEKFLSQHPHLQAELEAVASPLVINENLNMAYANKNSLKREELKPESFEYKCIAVVEGDMPLHQIESELNNNKQKQDEFKLFTATRLQPDMQVIYQHKQSLKQAVVVPMYALWTSLAAAASLALIWWLMPSPVSQQQVAYNQAQTMNVYLPSGLQPSSYQNANTATAIMYDVAINDTISPSSIGDSILRTNVAFLDTKNANFNLVQIKDVETTLAMGNNTDRTATNNNTEQLVVNNNKETGYKTIGEIALEKIKTKVLKIDENEKITAWNIAAAGVNGLGKIIDTPLALQHSQNADGELESLALNTSRFTIELK